MYPTQGRSHPSPFAFGTIVQPTHTTQSNNMFSRIVLLLACLASTTTAFAPALGKFCLAGSVQGIASRRTDGNLAQPPVA